MEAIRLAREMELELEEWKALRDVSCQVVPGNGDGLEVAPTPKSIREHLNYLQEEWDNAERRIAALIVSQNVRPLAPADNQTTNEDGHS